MCSGRNTQTAVRRKDEATNAIKDRNPREGRAGERAASRRRAPTKQLEKPVASDRASGCVKKQTPVTVETACVATGELGMKYEGVNDRISEFQRPPGEPEHANRSYFIISNPPTAT